MLSATSPLQQMHRNKHDADWTRAATMRRQDILRRVQAPVASEPVVIGHRGLKMNLAPDEHVRENTLQSFHSGISAGATFVEFDVQVSPLYIPDVFLDTLSQRPQTHSMHPRHCQDTLCILLPPISPPTALC
jgi:hypothetical protein